MEIMKLNEQWGVHDWTSGFRAEQKKNTGYNPEVPVNWQDAMKDPQGALELAVVARQYRLAKKILDELLS
jgi:hypothetical protein